MIKKNQLRDIFIFFGMFIALTIFITLPGHSQDTTKSKGDNKVRIVARIIEDKDGKRQEFDTTINLDRKLKPGEEKEMMKQVELRLMGLNDHMKHLEVEVNDMNLPDSLMTDSVRRLCKKAFIYSGCRGKGQTMRNCCPEAFNFDYNFEMPEFCRHPQSFFGEFGDESDPGMREEEFLMNKGKGESLNDLLGDIPMERVKSYSIKDTKNGKKITIELNKDPLVEHHEKVIIISSPGPGERHGQGRQQKMEKRIIIKNEE